MLLIADGDEKAFFEFYNHYSGLIRPFLHKYSRHETDVEDIIQETFVRVWLHRDQLTSIENIEGWIYKIASRVYLDYLDRKIKHQQRAASFGKALYGKGLVISGERTQLSEITKCIREAIDSLPEQKQVVFTLNRELDMKPGEIAEHLSMPVGTVKNQLSAALRHIREHLVNSGLGPITVLLLPTMLSYLFTITIWFCFRAPDFLSIPGKEQLIPAYTVL